MAKLIEMNNVSRYDKQGSFMYYLSAVWTTKVQSSLVEKFRLLKDLRVKIQQDA